MKQIIRFIVNDDKDGSVDVDIMPCASIMSGQDVILAEVNKGFDGNWKSLGDAAKELNNEITYCDWNEADKTFQWIDNGKGETYIISCINEKKSNVKWQNIARIR